MYEEGVLDNLRNKWFRKKGIKSCGDKGQVQISMNTLSDTLILLTMGILFSLLLMICEIGQKHIHRLCLKNESLSLNDVVLKRVEQTNYKGGGRISDLILVEDITPVSD